MGKGVVCHFFSNCLFATSRCIEKEAVDKMIAHFVTAPSFSSRPLDSALYPPKYLLYFPVRRKNESFPD